MPRQRGYSSSTCLVKVRVVLSAPTIEDCGNELMKKKKVTRNQTKFMKKLTIESCDATSPSSIRIPRTSIRDGFPRTVRERRRNLTKLKDYNNNYEDDIFECVDQSKITSKILLDASVSSSDSSPSPALTRKASPPMIPPILTREGTPLLYRAILERDKDEPMLPLNR